MQFTGEDVPLSSQTQLTRRPDPFVTVTPQLQTLPTDLLNLLASGHPALTELAQYYFHHPSKQIRPLLVLLLSQATNGLGKDWNLKLWESTYPAAGGHKDELNIPLSPPDVLTDYNPQYSRHTSTFHEPFVMTSDRIRSHRKPYPHNAKPPPQTQSTTPTLHVPTTILPTQLRLAQIVEMLHTASLLHDDAIDVFALRRGAPSAPSLFSNKLSMVEQKLRIREDFRCSCALQRQRSS